MCNTLLNETNDPCYLYNLVIRHISNTNQYQSSLFVLLISFASTTLSQEPTICVCSKLRSIYGSFIVSYSNLRRRQCTNNPHTLIGGTHWHQHARSTHHAGEAATTAPRLCRRSAPVALWRLHCQQTRS